MEANFTIQAGEKVIDTAKLNPLLFDDMDLFMGEEENKARASKEMIKKTIKEAYPNVTDEDISKILLKDTIKIAKFITKLNGFGEED